MSKNILANAMLVVTFLAIALLAGCGKSAASAAAGNSQLFSAEPLKDDWAMVVAAMQTNGYVIAVTNLDKMRTENPSPEQLGAINGTMRALSQQMADRAAKGDANARSAVEQLRTATAPRR